MSGDLHDLLVQKAAKWAIRAQRCTFVLLEPWHDQTEQPDVLGWQRRGWSVLVECKASRADFLRDRHKYARRSCLDDWSAGLGQERWYATAPGIIRASSELPARWGWLELTKRGRFLVRHPACGGVGADGIFHTLDTTILSREFSVLLSALRKAHAGHGNVPWLRFNPQASDEKPDLVGGVL